MTDRLLGIEIGGTKLQVVLGDANAEILEQRRFLVEPKNGAVGIRSNIEQALRELAAVSPAGAIGAVGVGFGGPVDFRNGTVAASHHIDGWDGFPLAEWLSKVTGLPVAMDNDANLAALAEAHKGAGQGHSRVFYITLGSGMGGGMVCDGVLYHGSVPGESEIGLLCYDPKTGANFESRCSGWATDKKVRNSVAKYPDSILAQFVGKAETDGEAKFLAPALVKHCPQANAILNQVCTDLAWAISHVVHLFDPEVVILGGGLSLLGEPLRAGTEYHLSACLCPTYQPGPEIRLAALGEDVVGIGALLLAKKTLSNHPHSA